MTGPARNGSHGSFHRAFKVTVTAASRTCETDAPQLPSTLAPDGSDAIHYHYIVNSNQENARDARISHLLTSYVSVPGLYDHNITGWNSFLLILCAEWFVFIQSV